MLNICHPVLVVTLCLLTAFVSSPVGAQTVPPPAVPQLPDEPLPEWRPPKKPALDVVHLDTSPEAARAQQLRQAGLWVSSFGGASLLLGGILYAYALDTNNTLSHPHPIVITGDNGSYDTEVTSTFDPGLEDRRNRTQAASFTFLIVGGVAAVGGFALFLVGQHQLRAHHRKYPKDPLPPLSGYDR